MALWTSEQRIPMALLLMIPMEEFVFKIRSEFRSLSALGYVLIFELTTLN